MHAIICCDEYLTGRHSFGDKDLIPQPTMCILPSTSMSFLNTVQIGPTLVTLGACAIQYPTLEPSSMF